jgi:hypothetical protein
VREADAGRFPTRHPGPASLTHSGPAARKVSLYRLSGPFLWFGNARLERIGEVDAGVNPFGIALVR